MKQQQPILGFFLALLCAMAWGSLPIALQKVLTQMTAQTVIGYRFLVAGLALLLLLYVTKNLPKLTAFTQGSLILIGLGVLGLAGNFLFFSLSLHYIEPAAAQIFIHLSSFGMLICGIFLFKEQFAVHQKIGLVLLIIGLALFFNDRFSLFSGMNGYSLGIILSMTGAFIWVIYGIAQKLLLRQFTSQQILLMIYLGCALVFMPFADYAQVQSLSPFVWGCFIYCCLNTLIGYGAYGEALNRWDVSKVSVVITLVPLFTILFSYLSHAILPEHFANPELNMISYIGAFVVVLSAMLSAVGHKFLKRKSLVKSR